MVRNDELCGNALLNDGLATLIVDEQKIQGCGACDVGNRLDGFIKTEWDSCVAKSGECFDPIAESFTLDLKH